MNALSKLAPVVSIIDGKPVTTSLDIAQHFQKQHKSVLRAVSQLDCSPEFTERNFAPSEYTDSTGRKLPMFQITRDGFVFLCMGFTGAEAAKWKEAYINAFNTMEEAIKQSSNPLQLPNHINAAQRGELSALIAERFPDGRDRPYAWGRFNNHFRLDSYKELPASKFDEACAYIPTMPLKNQIQVKTEPKPELTLNFPKRQNWLLPLSQMLGNGWCIQLPWLLNKLSEFKGQTVAIQVDDVDGLAHELRSLMHCAEMQHNRLADICRIAMR